MNADMGFDNQVTPPTRPPRGWFGRNWLWFVPVMLLVLLLLCGGCCLAFLPTILEKVKESELYKPYQMALEQVEKDPRVIERLGEPIRDVSWFPVGEVNVQNDRGEARLDFDVAGPKRRAHVRVQARMIDGQWGLSELTVTFADGQRLSLEAGAATERDEAPAFKPY